LKEAGVIPGGDMTPECALTKLAYVLAHDEWKPAEKKQKLLLSLRGERRIEESQTRFNFQNESFVTSLSHAIGAYGDEMKFFKDAVCPVFLCAAAGAGNLDVIRQMHADGALLMSQDYDGRSPLHLAAANGRIHVASYLIRHGALLSLSDHFGNTPLIDAIRGQHLEMVQLLRKAGALFPPGYDLATSLCNVAAADRIETLEIYAEAGADLNSSDYDKRTPLMVAIASRSFRVLDYLLRHETVLVHHHDTFGRTAEDYAREAGLNEYVEWLRNKSEGRGYSMEG
jgi:60kDa lysophospholipase